MNVYKSNFIIYVTKLVSYCVIIIYLLFISLVEANNELPQLPNLDSKEYNIDVDESDQGNFAKDDSKKNNYVNEDNKSYISKIKNFFFDSKKDNEEEKSEDKNVNYDTDIDNSESSSSNSNISSNNNSAILDDEIDFTKLELDDGDNKESESVIDNNIQEINKVTDSNDKELLELDSKEGKKSEDLTNVINNNENITSDSSYINKKDSDDLLQDNTDITEKDVSETQNNAIDEVDILQQKDFKSNKLLEEDDDVLDEDDALDEDKKSQQKPQDNDQEEDSSIKEHLQAIKSERKTNQDVNKERGFPKKVFDFTRNLFFNDKKEKEEEQEDEFVEANIYLTDAERFANNEVRILKLEENDDVVLGNLTQDAIIDNMSFSEYRTLFVREQNIELHREYLNDLNDFIDNYDNFGSSVTFFEEIPKIFHTALNNIKSDKITDLSLLRNLIHNYSIINMYDENGNTMLHHAVYQNKRDVILLLLYEGIDNKTKNKENKTPYDIALEMEYEEIINILKV